MRWMLMLVAIAGLLLSGCAEKFYKVSRDEYRVRVQTLGVLPLLVDADSLKIYPEADELTKVLLKHNLGKDARLIEMLRGVKGYFDIRHVAGEPALLFKQLVATSALNDREPRHRSYRFDAEVVQALADRNGVDALLIIVVNGVTRGEKRWDRTALNYINADFDMLLATATVATVSGDVVWEFPGYAAEPFAPLQFPDFDEAYHNLAAKVAIKDITLAGVDRLLSEPERSIFGRMEFSKRYHDLFARLAAALEPSGKLPTLPLGPSPVK